MLDFGGSKDAGCWEIGGVGLDGPLWRNRREQRIDINSCFVSTILAVCRFCLLCSSRRIRGLLCLSLFHQLFTKRALRTSSPGSEVVISILRSSITRSQVGASTFPPSNTDPVRQVSLLRTQIFISSSINTATVNSLCDFETRKIQKLTSVQATTAVSHRTQLHLQRTISLFKLPPLRFQLSLNMPVNWKDPEAFTRLLASMVAAQDLKVYTHLCFMFCRGRFSFLCSQ